MTKILASLVHCCAATGTAVSLIFAGGCASMPKNPQSDAGREALRFAFDFADTIHTDASAKAEAQAKTVILMAELGWREDAVARVRKIDGWDQGVAYAELGRHFARAGLTNEARQLLTKAVAVAKLVKDWYEPRIYAHVAQAQVELGEVEQVRALAQGIGREESPKVAAAMVSGLARDGKYNEGMAKLQLLDDMIDFEVTWWRTMGYLRVAQQPGLGDFRRDQALAGAKRSAYKMPGPRRSDALIAVADAYREAGKRKEAWDTLEYVSAGLTREQIDQWRSKVSISDLASAWGRVGRRRYAVWLLKDALSDLDKVEPAFKPNLCTRIAGAHADARDLKKAWALYRQAISLAAQVENPRPRALALAEVCRSVGRRRLELPMDIHQQLEQLLKGLAPQS